MDKNFSDGDIKAFCGGLGCMNAVHQKDLFTFLIFLAQNAFVVVTNLGDAMAAVKMACGAIFVPEQAKRARPSQDNATAAGNGQDALQFRRGVAAPNPKTSASRSSKKNVKPVTAIMHRRKSFRCDSKIVDTSIRQPHFDIRTELKIAKLCIA